ncbi:hypothetical protein BDA99DRAFT_37486 [Phascolomyces articulosus]|uniref:Uncharacterized protein n=1 Tax=Phascolomyces articulosus TaxID=60185 RepID=A0AAD5K1S6_9FUNG|nr:hypothetical protein BDA99DRAFT_37486 [Phascolomyces articulosus]
MTGASVTDSTFSVDVTFSSFFSLISSLWVVDGEGIDLDDGPAVANFCLILAKSSLCCEGLVVVVVVDGDGVVTDDEDVDEEEEGVLRTALLSVVVVIVFAVVEGAVLMDEGFSIAAPAEVVVVVVLLLLVSEVCFFERALGFTILAFQGFADTVLEAAILCTEARTFFRVDVSFVVDVVVVVEEDNEGLGNFDVVVCVTGLLLIFAKGGFASFCSAAKNGLSLSL